MFFKPTTIFDLLLSTTTLLLGATNTAMAATYDFLTVSSTGATSSQFTSSNGNGYITVDTVFTPGGQGGDHNNNPAIFPSQFPTLFPGSGQVQGHLVQTVYNHRSVVTFDLTNYNLSSSTVFGIWNTTTEITPAPYRVEVIDIANTASPPTSFNLLGNEDNFGQVAGKHTLLLNTGTGQLSPGAVINAGGTHTDAAFWDNLNMGLGTKEIIVYGDLGPLNLIGDGVGYYFAELIPEPGSCMLMLSGVLVLALKRRRA